MTDFGISSVEPFGSTIKEFVSMHSVIIVLQGFKQQALAVSTDPEHKFELALQLGELQTAHLLALEAASQQKWRQLAELATTRGELDLAQECLHHAQDYGGLLLLATSSGTVH
jgi:coatomer subunit beta'